MADQHHSGSSFEDLLKECVIYDEIQDSVKELQRQRRWQQRLSKIRDASLRYRDPIA